MNHQICHICGKIGHEPDMIFQPLHSGAWLFNTGQGDFAHPECAGYEKVKNKNTDEWIVRKTEVKK
jgi:hypothetical protein